jgi:3-oxoacyl-[acyl-carrier protein] reductase
MMAPTNTLIENQGLRGASTGLLRNKRAVVFGAGGSIGAAVAREFASEGAEVFLAGRTKSNIEQVAKEIIETGGHAHTAAVDALDDAAVNRYIDGVAQQSGGIDIAFNAVGTLASEYGVGKHAVDLTIEEFMVPAMTVLKSQFITARAAARHMLKQHSGVIIFLTGSPARGHVQGGTSIGAAFGAIESLTENLAVEVSPAGVRVVCLRTTANVDSRTIQQVMDATAAKTNSPREQLIAGMGNMNFLKSPASIHDTARAAVLIASDRARLLTGTVVNSTAGAAAD